jgi:glucose-1-phosphate cytidylyltransferase
MMSLTRFEAASPEVVILCGGRGTRLGPETDILPKPLVRVGGRPILWHIMAHYARYGLKRFVLCLGYRGEAIRDYFLNYRLHNHDFTLTLNGGKPRVVAHDPEAIDWEVTCADTGLAAQTGARIRRVAKYIQSPDFFCTYGDGVSDIDLQSLLRFHRSHGRIATVTGVHPPARFGEFEIEDEIRVARFVEKAHPTPRVRVGYVNGGFLVFSRAVFDYLSDDDSCALEQEPLRRLAADDQLRVFKHEGFWQCMDTPKDRDTLDELLAERSVVREHARTSNGNDSSQYRHVVPGARKR